MEPNEPAAAALSRILTLLNHTWVRDFIFPQETQQELLHLALMAAHESPHPSTGLMQIATLPTKEPQHALDETMHLLYVPSFTTGDITVGFQVYERIRTNTVNPNRLYLGRTVRDDINGMFLAISEHPSLGIYELSYGTQLSACSREHALMQFQTGPLLEALSNTPASLGQILQALLYSFYSIEQKPCSICPTKNGTCKCTIRTRRKRGCHDYDMENSNLETYCGDFDGVATVGSFWNGSKVFTGEVCSRVETRIVRNDGLGVRLAQWGMMELSGGMIRRKEVHPVTRIGILGERFNCDMDSFAVGEEYLKWLLSDDETMIPLSNDNEEDLNKSLPIAPAGVVVDTDRPPDIDEQAWRKELKKRRNRAAAHRSNEKKRLELQMMKQQIEEGGRRVRALREREKLLRMENRGLREAVTQL